VSRAASLVAAAILVGSLSGCAAALREPPSAAELAGPPPRSPVDVDRLLRDAERAFAERTVESARQAREAWFAAAAAAPSRSEAWIGACRADVWLAGHQDDPAARDAAAVEAVQAAQLCAEAAPADPACSYWLAVALGVQARERRSTGHDALPRIVELLERAAAARPEMEHAGPHRVLALVLLRAPGWPTGPGDPDRGLEHARRAVALAPEFPPNRMCLAEALAAVDEHERSREALAAATDLAREWSEAGHPDAEEWLAEIEAVRGGGR
jgi:hypothetical protein